MKKAQKEKEYDNIKKELVMSLDVVRKANNA